MAALQIARTFGLATVQSALCDIKINREGGLLSTLHDVPVTGSEVTSTLRIIAEAPVPYKEITVTLKEKQKSRNMTVILAP